ncbi:ATPase subunit of ABC transporter with duplicated ATPase domains [Micrococcus aloeverae]
MTEQKRQQLVKKELAWLRRGAPARTSKPKFRIEAANAIIEDVPAPRDSVSLAKMATARLGKDVLDLEHVSLTLGEKPILDDVTLRLAPGERLGVVGVNGAGKSTLLRLLDGRIAPDSGRVKRGKTVVSATLTQDVKELDDVAHLRVAEVMAREGSSFQVGDREMSSGQLLEMLGFGTSRQWTQVSELSGGERRRLQLLRLLVGEPNVLMLDEPTNDLDTDTLAAVEDVLDGWPGTLVVVSHDRYLLERVTDHQVALLGDGKVRGLPGGVDQYLELRAAMDDAGGPARGAGAARGRNDVVGTCAGMGGPEEDTGPTEAERRLARKEMARLEKQMTRLRDRRSGLEARMAELGQAQDFDALTAASADLKDLDAQLDVLEEEWLQAAELAEGD